MKNNKLLNRLLCKLGIHNWRYGEYTIYGFTNTRKCKRCSIKEIEKHLWWGREYEGSKWVRTKDSPK